KFSFERYRGAAAQMLKDRVTSVDIADPNLVRFRLKRPWPDFMTFYGSLATSAGWIVAKKYVERVGVDGFKKAPVGAGPYKFVSLLFAEQWDPKSLWSDRRVRLAANLAIDREAINQAETLGLSKLTASIIPRSFEGYWPAPLYAYDPQRAKQLMAEAGYPNGFD